MHSFTDFIKVLLTFFMLSSAIERIANLVKLAAPAIFSKKAKHIVKTVTDQQIALRVALLNFILSWMVLLIFENRFDAFYLTLFDNKNNPTGNLNDPYFYFITVIEALAISFGSVCWHEVLNIIFHIKNRKKIASNLKKAKLNKYKNSQSAIDQLKILNLARSSNNVTQEVITAFLSDEQNQKLAKKYDCKRLSQGYKKIKGNETPFPALLFGVENKIEAEKLMNDKIIPLFINYDYQGVSYKIPTDVNYADQTIACNGNIPQQPGNGLKTICPGLGVSRYGFKSAGTLGPLVKKKNSNEKYIVSCFHVLFEPELSNAINNNLTEIKNISPPYPDSFGITTPADIDDGKVKDLIGFVKEGIFGNSMDAAIALIDHTKLQAAGKIFSNEIYGTFLIPKKILKHIEIKQDMDVYISGRTSGRKKGKVKSCYAVDKITYGKKEIKYYNLIQTTRISDGGDSGAPVYDSTGDLLGILIATNIKENFSYVLSMERIATYFNLDLIK